MLDKKIRLLIASLFFAAGCVGDKSHKKIQFSVVDLRDVKDNDICAVSFSSLSRFVKIPLVTYVANPCACMLNDVYAQGDSDGTELGVICVVAQAESRFAELVGLCKAEKVGSDLTVAVTLYGRNARPMAYLIDEECYLKIVSSWTVRCLQRDEILRCRQNHYHNYGEFTVDFDGLCAIVGSDDYRLLSVLSNDDYLTVDAYGDCGALCEKSFYRQVGHFFRQRDGSERFLGHLKTHLNSWVRNDSSVRVVLWR